MNQDTSVTGGSLMPYGYWAITGESAPPEAPQWPKWGEGVEGVRMYDWDGEPDDYNDLRLGQTEDGRLVLGVGCDCGCGYAFIDAADLRAWAMERRE